MHQKTEQPPLGAEDILSAGQTKTEQFHKTIIKILRSCRYWLHCMLRKLDYYFFLLAYHSALSFLGFKMLCKLNFVPCYRQESPTGRNLLHYLMNFPIKKTLWARKARRTLQDLQFIPYLSTVLPPKSHGQQLGHCHEAVCIFRLILILSQY